MGPKEDLVLVDTNVFVIDLRYKRDAYYKVSPAFLDHMVEKRNGFTTIVNLLELCGILSFDLAVQLLNCSNPTRTTTIVNKYF